MTESIRQRWRDGIRDTTSPTIDGLTIAVAMALDRYMTADGTTKSGVRTLARLARVTHGTVTDRTNRLEAAGWLHIDRAGRGGRTVYRATLPDNCPAPPDTNRPAPPDTPVSGPTGHPDPSSNGRSVRPHGSKVSGPTEKSVRPHRTDPVGIPKGSRREGASASGRTTPAGAAASGSRPPRAAGAEGAPPGLGQILGDLCHTDDDHAWAFDILLAIEDTPAWFKDILPARLHNQHPDTLKTAVRHITQLSRDEDIDIRLPKGPK